jgi:hypothetical protein
MLNIRSPVRKNTKTHHCIGECFSDLLLTERYEMVKDALKSDMRILKQDRGVPHIAVIIFSFSLV